MNGNDSGPGFPSLVVAQGQHVQLRHTLPADYDFLYFIETTGRRTVDFRLRGATPGFESYVQGLRFNVHAFLLVESRDGRKPLGLQVAYNANMTHGHAKVAAVYSPDLPAGGSHLEGSVLFLDFLFATYPFRKVYGDVLAHNYKEFSSNGLGVFVEEGRLREHEYYDGSYEDLILIALYREAWNAFRTAHVDSFAAAIRVAEGRSGSDSTTPLPRPSIST